MGLGLGWGVGIGIGSEYISTEPEWSVKKPSEGRGPLDGVIQKLQTAMPTYQGHDTRDR